MSRTSSSLPAIPGSTDGEIMESHLGFYSAFPDIGNYFRISGIGIPDIGNQFPISGNDRFPDIGKWFSGIGGNWFSDIGKCAEKPYGFLFSISRYREFEFSISGNQFPISGNGRFPDIGKWFSDIGNWFSDIGKCAWFPDIGKSIPDIRKSPPDRSRSLRHPATPPYHTAPYQQRPPAIPASSACGHRHYDFSKSQCTYSNTRSVQPTII